MSHTVDIGFRERSFSCTAQNTDDAISVRTEMIQRKGSTFRPHDSPRGSSGSSSRKRKEKRATVVGVPHHIAAELGLQSSGSSLHRGIHELFPRERQPVANQAPISLSNGIPRTEEEFVTIPTVDGNANLATLDGAHISLATLEQTEATVQRHIDKVYKDDSYIDIKCGPKMSPMLIRPKSLAVPGMTTHSHQSDHVGPVMSISPQATYMSKIIPNAVLPPMVDLVALTHSSVRTLSRCSLATASPASVRGSLHRGRVQSFSSDTWSRSESTETIVSDSSTISSHGGTKEPSEKNDSQFSTGRASPASSSGTQDESDAASLCSARSSVRSVSLRKSKKAPPPPKRTYSLQQQREMGLPPRPERKPLSKSAGNQSPCVSQTEALMLDNEVFSQPLYSAKLSSPSRSDRTLSPSSGYSSQSGTPTMPAKALLEYPESPGSHRKTPQKPERTSLTRSKQGSSVSTNSSAETSSPILTIPPRAGSSVFDQDHQEALEVIPPHPKVSAPVCPPPNKIRGHIGTPSSTPNPSPPPSHHPTPPPTRKSDSGEVMPAYQEVLVQTEIMWPPPPPDVPELQDMSMANYPPPEDLILPPPQAPESDLLSIRNSDQICIPSEKDDIRGNTHKLTDSEKNSGISIASKPLIASVPFFAAKDSLPSFTEHTIASAPSSIVHITLHSASSADVQTASVIPSSVSNTLIPLTSSIKPTPKEPTPPESVPSSVQSNPEPVTTADPKPASAPCSTEPNPVSLHPFTDPALLSVHLPTEDASETTVEPVGFSIMSKSTVCTSAPLAVIESSKSVKPFVPVSPSSKPSAWKPVTAPSKKVAAPNSPSVAAPKDDANLPIVTPSLLQMVRLRSVQVKGPQGLINQQASGVSAPQKPMRKSLSLRSPPGSSTPPADSTTEKSPLKTIHDPRLSPSTHRSPASAASFVFARGAK
ncbi:hypothetical protein GDO86_003712, partial [Hymenochirus boettgeri]